MFRILLCLAICTLSILPILAGAQDRTNPPGVMTELRNTGIRGSSFHTEEMGKNLRQACADTCLGNPICKGYNWRKWREGRAAQCTLYHVVFETVQTQYFHAGLRGRGVPAFQGTRETDTELRGEVFKEIELPLAKPKMCRDACAVEGICKGYSYVKPGKLSPSSPPTCRLLTEVTERRDSGCCVSGRSKDSFVAFRFHPNTRMHLHLPVRTPVSDVKACVHMCRSDDACTHAVYRKTTASDPVGSCYTTSLGASAQEADGGFTTYEKVAADDNMNGPRPGVASVAPTYRRLFLDARDDEDALFLCRAACVADVDCTNANFLPKRADRSATCNLKKTLEGSEFNDCCTGNSKASLSKPPSVPAPGSVPLRMQFSQNSRYNVIEGDRYPQDMPNVRFPVNWQGCSVAERYQLRRAWARAHHHVWRARQVMAHLNAQRRRAEMWRWSFTDRMGNDPNYNNIAPRAYFGRYDHKRFHMVRRSMDKLFVERFRNKTFIIKCRQPGRDGAHPCETGRSSANHIVYGRINICQRWFDTNSLNDQASSLIHEVLHWMKIPKSVFWLTDRHDFWRSCRKYRRVQDLYDNDAVWLGMNRGCKDWNHNRAVRVIDTYAWWATMLGDRIYSGRLPQFPAEDF